MLVRPLPLLVLPALATLCGAQQFTLAPDALPGPHDRWTEGVEAADADQDGDLDVFLAHGGGWSDAFAVAYPNTILVNRLVEDGAFRFVDESATRLGGSSPSKMVVTADADGDGWIDALFCNCFGGSPPSLYMNRGAAQPGFFDQEGAQRGLGEVLYSYSGAFGDVDADGDLDLVLGDSTSFWDFLDGAAAQEGAPRLYLNDGSGNFGEASPADWAPAIDRGTHDVQMVDIDNDWDVDVVVSNVTFDQTHYLMINDGSGSFTDEAALLPEFSANCFETEFGDLDGDTDLDLFVVGLDEGPEGDEWKSPNGPVRNLFEPTGPLAFEKGPGKGQDDVNEAILVDYDMDGDLDAFVTALDTDRDQVHRNNGVNFELVPGVLPPGIDPNHPSLDATCADFDGDGDVDYFSVQGEYNNADWTNTLFLNSGPPDTLAPVVLREELLDDELPLASPWVVRAQVADQVMDDGKDWLTATALVRVTDVLGVVHATEVSGLSIASGLDRFALGDSTGGLGASLEYELRFRDRNGNETVTPTRQATLAGIVPFGTDAGGANVLEMTGSGSAVPGGTVTATITGIADASAVTLLSLAPWDVPVLGGSLLVDLGVQALPPAVVPAAAGQASVDYPLPSNQALVGLHLFGQAAALDGTQSEGWAFSNGLHLAIGPSGS